MGGRFALNRRHLAFAAVCLLCVSTVQYHLLVLIHSVHSAAQVDAAANVLLGHPAWKSYQSRLLGPEIVLWLALFSGESYVDCYQFFCFAALCVGNTICYCLFYRHCKRPDVATVYTILYAALFVGCQDERWLYLWDFIDLSVMLLFAWAVVIGGGRLWQFAALFCVELFNRESAVFIALWMMIDACEYNARPHPGPRLRLHLPGLAAGMALGIAGTLWTNFIRHRLFIENSGDGVWHGLHENAGGQLFILPITYELFSENSYLTISVLFIIFGATAFFLRRAWLLLAERAWKILLFLGALTAANFCFAYIFELRVWLTFSPFILCLAYFRQSADRLRLDQPGSRAPGAAPA